MRNGLSASRRRRQGVVMAELLEARRMFVSFIYVDASATGNGSGSSWANAFTSLNAAFAAAHPSDTVKIGPGIYKPTASTNRSATFTIPNGVLVFGGYEGAASATPDKRDSKTNITTLSGDIGVAGVNTDNVYHVVTFSGSSNSTFLDGVQITGGYADGTGGVNSSSGAGILYLSSQAILSNLTIYQNTTVAGPAGIGGGAGLYLSNPSTTVAKPFVLNTTFNTNTAIGGGLGGGMYVAGLGGPQLTGCFFNGNSAAIGGAVYNSGATATTYSTTDFNNNTATQAGGAVANVAGTVATFTRSRVQNNLVSNPGGTAFGGGVYNDASTVTFTSSGIFQNLAIGTTTSGGGLYNSHNSSAIVNTTIVYGNNTAGDGGGAFNDASSTLVASNSVFNGNKTTAGNGGGIFESSSRLSLVNVTLSGNSALAGAGGAIRFGAGAGGTIVNSIVYNDLAATESEISRADTAASLAVTFTDVQGGFAGTGNVNVDPQFVGAADPTNGGGGDLHLQTGSNVSDIGNNAVVVQPAAPAVALDVDGKTRIQANVVDMGAYESTPPVDTNAPTSSVTALTATQPTATFTVNWSGTDSIHGSGLATYTIYYSDNGGAYQVLVADTTATSNTFSGVNQHTYTFYSVAKDKAGNVEAKSAIAEATTSIDLPDLIAPTSAVAALPQYTKSLTIPLTWSGSDDAGGKGLASFTVFVSDNGGDFVPFLTDTTATTGTFTGVAGHTYGFYTRAKDLAGNVESQTVADTVTQVDISPPTSSVTALPAISPATIAVSWTGQDDVGGSGIATYTVFVSDNGGAYTPFVTNTALTTGNFTAAEGHTYTFYSLATDKAGNVEVKDPLAEATTSSDATAPVSSVAALPAISLGTTINLTWSGADTNTGLKDYTIYSSDNGAAYTAILSNTTLTSTTFQGVPGHTYRFYSAATDNAGNVEAAPTTPDATTLVDNPLLAEHGTNGSTGELVVQSVKVALPKPVAGQIIDGGKISGSVKVQNTGEGLLTGMVPVSLYLSSDNVPSGADAFLGTVMTKSVKLKKNGSASVAFNYLIPLAVSGTQHVLAVVNPNGAVSEATTLNNVFAAPSFVATAQSLNLTTVSIKTPQPHAGKTATASVVLQNNSNVLFNHAVPITLTFTDDLTHTARTLTTKATTVNVKAKSGGKQTVSIVYTVPANLAGLAGSLKVSFDPAATITETTHADNDISSSLIVAAK